MSRKSTLPEPGCAYSFTYPRHNFTGVSSTLEPRRMIVQSIRDTAKDRLDPTTEKLQPMLNRGRWLVTGTDLDKGQERSFYFESMRSIERVDPDYQPADAGHLVVVDGFRVSYIASTLREALAYLAGSRRGVLCGKLSKTEKTSGSAIRQTLEIQ